MSARTLRRLTGDLGLPKPQALLRRTRLLEALALGRMGIGSTTCLASMLGMRDPKAISRLCRELTGEPFHEMLLRCVRNTFPLALLEASVGVSPQ